MASAYHEGRTRRKSRRHGGGGLTCAAVLLALVYAVVGIFGLLGVFVHPGWAVCGYFAAAFGRPNELDWSIHTARISMPMVAAAGIGAVFYFMRRGYPKVGSLQMKLITLMIIHMAVAGWILESSWVQVLGHSRPVQSADLWNKFEYYWKMYVVLWLTSRVVVEEGWVERLFGTFALCGGLLGVWANYHYFVLNTHPITGPGPPAGIFAGIFEDRNDFCLYLSMSMVACWYMAVLSKSLFWRAFWLAFEPFLLHAILLTESRGGLMGAALGIGVCAWRSKYRWSLTVGGVAGMALVLLFFTNDALLERYGTIKDYEGDASALGRLNSWSVGWRMMWGNPLFGAGLENYIDLFYDYSDWRPTWTTLEDGTPWLVQDVEYEINRARQAHNMWLQRGGETGLLGLAILAALVVSIPLAVRQARGWLTSLQHAGRISDERFDRLCNLTYAIDGTLLPYLLTGFFLSMEDFEGFYLVAVLCGAVVTLIRREYDAAFPDGHEAGPPGTAQVSSPTSTMPSLTRTG